VDTCLCFLVGYHREHKTMVAKGKRKTKRNGAVVVKKANEVEAPGGPACQPTALSYDPGVSPGAIDVTGITPSDVHIDPDITEGHPGYEESGRSGLGIPR
jgi:hypothetical protein